MKRVLFKLIKGLSIAICLVTIVVFSIYSIAWYSFTKRAEVYIETLWLNKNLVISGEKPRFSGYPLIPETRFSGSVEQQDDFKFSTPELIYTGFPAPMQTQVLEAPKGLQISSNYLERDLTFDYAFMQFYPPNHLPYSTKRADVAAWQKDGNELQITKIVLKAGNIYAHGSGTLSLDDNLQLSANIDARVVGMDVLFDELAKEKGEKTIAIARSFFEMMSKIDDKTGEKYFETTLKIQNRGMYFGPMRISGLPELKWN